MRVTLTRREREVLDRIFEGKTSREIALEMGLSRRTVEVHRYNLRKKMGVSVRFPGIGEAAIRLGIHSRVNAAIGPGPVVVSQI